MARLKDVERLVNGLSLSDRLELVRRLERDTWTSRLDTVVTRIRLHTPRLSQREILRLCQDVRRGRSHRARRA